MKIPLFPLDVVLFPGTALPLHIFEGRYKEMIGECLAQKSAFGVVRAQREGLAVIGCTARIVRVLETYDDGRLDLLCQGSDRFEIENLDNSRSFLQAEVDFFGDEALPRGARCASNVRRCILKQWNYWAERMRTCTSISTSRSHFNWRRRFPPDLGSSRNCLDCGPTANAPSICWPSTTPCCPSCGVECRPARWPAANGHVM